MSHLRRLGRVRKVESPRGSGGFSDVPGAFAMTGTGSRWGKWYLLLITNLAVGYQGKWSGLLAEFTQVWLAGQAKTGPERNKWSIRRPTWSLRESLGQTESFLAFGQEALRAAMTQLSRRSGFWGGGRTGVSRGW